MSDTTEFTRLMQRSGQFSTDSIFMHWRGAKSPSSLLFAFQMYGNDWIDDACADNDVTLPSTTVLLVQDFELRGNLKDEKRKCAVVVLNKCLFYVLINQRA